MPDTEVIELKKTSIYLPPFSTTVLLDELPKLGSSLLPEESPLSMGSPNCSHVL